MLKSSLLCVIGLSLFIWMGTSCSKTPSVKERLSGIDKLLQVDPQRGIDSLNAIDIKNFNYSEVAYYNLLLTIAQHKGNIPFTSDSLISFSRQWFESHGDTYNFARACFYHGLTVLFVMKDNALACEEMRQALQLLSSSHIKDERLEALACAYLGRINDLRILNLPEAAKYYRRAVEIESRLNNGRNLISDYCNLLVCYVKMGEASLARETLTTLDSVQAVFPECKLEKTKNAKALYYLHSSSDIDSALFYSLSWNPTSEDASAKAFLLSEIYQRKELWPEAIAYAKEALNDRRESDTLSFHVYYSNLADLYSQLGVADSAAHYAQLAYGALKESVSQKTEKRILELEKQYDLSAKEAEVERERNRRNILLVLLCTLLAIIGLLGWQWKILRKNAALEQRESLKDIFARSVLNAIVDTYSGTNKRLTVIHNLPDEERQGALNRFIQDNKSNAAKNLSAALEENFDALPGNVREVFALLDGVQQKTVFILTEMGFPPGEIGRMIGISSNQVRTVKTAVRDRIATSPVAHRRDVRQLQVMQVGQPVAQDSRSSRE